MNQAARVAPAPSRDHAVCLLRTDVQAEARTVRKSAPWKIALAAWLKQQTQASNRWLCDQLHMGTPFSVSQLVGQLRRQGDPAARLHLELTEKLKTLYL